MNIELPQKSNSDSTKTIQIITPEDILNISEVQEIKNADREYVLALGLNNRNFLQNISLVGLGLNTATVDINAILRTALIKGNTKIVLVHNHPSNSLEPSLSDKICTNILSRLSHLFNIELLDHIIVTEKEYVSMRKLNEIEYNLEDNNVKFLSDYLICNDNLKLQEEIKELKKTINMYQMNERMISDDKEKNQQKEDEFIEEMEYE